MKEIIEMVRNVSSTLGNHYRENIYQQALMVDFNNKNYIVQSEVVLPIKYRNITVGFERADIVIYEEFKPTLVLELKSQNSRLGTKEISQLRRYMSNLECHTGVLVNFYETLEIIEVYDTSHKKIQNDMHCL